MNRSIFAPIALILGIGLSACGGQGTVADDGSDGQPPNVPSGQAEVEGDGGGNLSSLKDYATLEELFSSDRLDELMFENGQQAGLRLCQEMWGSPADVLNALGKDAPPEGMPDLAWDEFLNENADEEFRNETDDPYSASPYFIGYNASDPDPRWQFRCQLSYKYDGDLTASVGVLYLTADSASDEDHEQDNRYFYHTVGDVDFTITMVPGGDNGVDVDPEKGVAYLSQVSERLPESQG